MPISAAKLKTLRVNPDWATLPLFDRTGWTRLAFGQFAENVNQRVEPAEAADEIYVGLEHLDPGCLHIRRSGKGSDVIGTKLRFRKGDIIFGRRRAYQRKLAVAETEGICSAHAMVVRAKSDVVLPEFLPFLMMSDKFMNRAVEISVGSLSPTINWTTLKVQEFDLPPIEQQRRIAQILWKVNEAVESLDGLLKSLEAAQDAEFASGLQTQTAPQRLDHFTSLITDGDHNPPKRTPAGIPHVLVQNIVGGAIDFANCTKIAVADLERAKKRYAPQKSDILLVCVGATIGKAGVVGDFTDFSTDRSLAVIRFNPAKVIPEYGYALVMSRPFQTKLLRNCVGTAQPHLFLGDIRRIQCVIPSLAVQTRTVKVLRQLDAARRAAFDTLSQLTTLSGELGKALSDGANV